MKKTKKDKMIFQSPWDSDSFPPLRSEFLCVEFCLIKILKPDRRMSLLLFFFYYCGCFFFLLWLLFFVCLLFLFFYYCLLLPLIFHATTACPCRPIMMWTDASLPLRFACVCACSSPYPSLCERAPGLCARTAQ